MAAPERKVRPLSHSRLARTALAALIGLTAPFLAPLHAAGPVPASPAAPAPPAVVTYSGTVDPRTAQRFLALIAGHRDEVIGLDILVMPNRKGDFRRKGYLVDYSDDQLSISLVDPKGLRGGLEVVRNGPAVRQADGYRLDGLFVVRSGGRTQGVSSFGLETVDPATARTLRAASRAAPVPF